MTVAINWLNNKIGARYPTNLSKMRQAMTLLDDPYPTKPIIHVTGTNGKGSTIAFLENLFLASTKQVLSFTSPHFRTPHERISFNKEPISNIDFNSLLQSVMSIEPKLEAPLHYFEVMTLLYCLYAKEVSADILLVEVGIGGFFDSTNILDGDIAVITSIGYDHQDLLGNSLDLIAYQKAGIIKTGSKVIVGPVPEAAAAVILEKAYIEKASLYRYGKEIVPLCQEGSLGLEGDYQTENASLALAAYHLLIDDESRLSSDKICASLESAFLWGRMERLSQSANVYVDGAHNVSALARLVESSDVQKKAPTFLLAGLKRKNRQDMLDYLSHRLPDASIFLTKTPHTDAWEETGSYPFVSLEPFLKTWITQKPESLLIVTGSLYLAADVKTIWQEDKCDR